MENYLAVLTGVQTAGEKVVNLVELMACCWVAVTAVLKADSLAALTDAESVWPAVAGTVAWKAVHLVAQRVVPKAAWWVERKAVLTVANLV